MGTGQVGRAVADRLARLGHDVRAFSRERPAELSPAVEWQSANLTDPEAALDAAKGADVIYQCLNAPYTRWPELFPPLQAHVLAAAERAGALLVSLENLYGYGPVDGTVAMTEDLPLAPTTSKGVTRAAMTAELLAASAAGRVRMAIGRASDFFGAGVTESIMGSRIFGNAVAGKRAIFTGDPDQLHTYSYVPDIADGLVTLGTDPQAIGQVWHLPGPQTVTTRALVELIAERVGHPVHLSVVPDLVVRALGLVSPMMRGVEEMSYQCARPFVMDTSKFESTFATTTTPLATAVGDTVAWYEASRSNS